MEPKPVVLYHASSNKLIKQFEPRAESVRDPLEGPVVFATPDKAYASMFLVPADDSWTIRGSFSDRRQSRQWHMVISDRPRFMALDHGGSIYHLDPSTFASDATRNLAGTEWVSTVAVLAISRDDYEFGLSAMKQFGVKVYFSNQQTFDDIRNSNDHGFTIINSLTNDI